MRHRTILKSIAAALVLAWSSAGCGFVFAHGPPVGNESMDYFTCTEGDAAPILDGIWSGLNLFGALAVANDRDSYDQPDALISSGLIWATVGTVSGIVGSRKIKRCRKAKAALAARVQAGMQPSDERPPLTIILPVSERDRRTLEQYGVSATTLRAARSYWRGSSDDVVKGVLRAMAGAGFHAVPTSTDHDCFAGFDATRDDDVVTVLVCEADAPISPELRWEVTVTGVDRSVVNAVRDAIESEKP